MPRDPKEERIETDEGEAPVGGGEVPGDEESVVSRKIPDSVFDQRQRQIGQRRKPAGPPLRDDDGDGDDGDDGREAFGGKGRRLPDVPPTEPGEAP